MGGSDPVQATTGKQPGSLGTSSTRLGCVYWGRGKEQAVEVAGPGNDPPLHRQEEVDTRSVERQIHPLGLEHHPWRCWNVDGCVPVVAVLT